MEKRVYRLLALAAVFMLIGVFFFFYNKKIPSQSAPAPYRAGSGAGFLDPVLSRFPPPEKYQRFSHGMQVVTPCNDAYVALLVFPAAVDYRKDVAKAVFNQAFSCERGRTFSHTFRENNLASVKEGEYYLIIADQGTSGAWYNLR